ncbi:MAG TPA: hypothetical protein VJ464_06500 [Blastocatellia bacterium]|nr:hypothetical protein [Blastocatellia bacterium]
MTPVFPIYNFTPAAAQQQLQNDGLDALGLTTVALSPHWATANITANGQAPLTLKSPAQPGQLRAPFRGILQGAFAPANSFLQNALAKGDTAFNVLSNMGQVFPAPAGGGGVVLAISNSDGSKREFVLLTARNNDTFTVTRGYNGSAAQDFDAGDLVSLVLGRNNTSVKFSDANGQPLQMTCAIFRFHPQAALRLARLMAVRYENNTTALIRPVPHAMVIHNAGFYLTDQIFEADAPLPSLGNFDFSSQDISFHDERGLIIDPVYVAALFADLLAAFPALQPAGVTGGVGDVGGINSVLGLGNGTLYHFINPHGGPFQPANAMATAIGNQPATGVPATGLVQVPQGQVATIKAANPNGPLRWGWATNGVMTANDLIPPALPGNVNLPRQFFRICAVDINRAVLGNRTDGTVLGVQKDDGRLSQEFGTDAASFLPAVRDQVIIDYLVDGPDTLSEITRVLQPAPPKDVMLAVSMEWDNTLITPGTAGATAHWPLFPPAAGGGPAGAPAMVPSPLPAGAVTAALSTQDPRDIVVTLTGVAPFDSYVRIYPQMFIPIEAIGPEPSFVRGDGGANICAGAAVSVLLVNPFGLQVGQATPSQLTVDIVIAPRGGGRQLFGAVNVPVNVNGPAVAPPATPFVGAPPVLALFPPLQGIAPSPLFGVPVPPNPPTPTPGTFTALLLSFVAETMPRQAPRYPTQARFETIAVSGTPGGANGTLLWDGVITGARWSPESRSAQHDLGNPGNPAGPDIHAPGVRVTGALAYDAAYVALRRAEPMIPWPGTTLNFPGWVLFSAGNNFNPPSDAANVNNTSTGAVLRTIARACETSQLSEKNIPSDDDLNQDKWLDNILKGLGFNVTVNFPINNDARLRKEVRREFFISKHGLRDAQWSLLRAISEARELVYIESPQFARTARPADAANPKDYEIDLVQTLASRLQAFANLKVIICTPKLSDFMPQFKSWAHQHYEARAEAVGKLLAVARDRVAVFHPIGFPGRPVFIRTTSVIVDDVWALVGATHFRRRGMTFDGSAAVSSFDRMIENGYSKKVRDYRQALMAAKLRVPAPVGNLARPPADWIRLSRPGSAFALVQDLLAQGGLGRIESLWPGPQENVQAVDAKVSDPDGSTSADYAMLTIDGVLNEAGK